MKLEREHKLRGRVVAAAEAVLADQGYVSAIDVLGAIGWLDTTTLKRWQQSRIPCLEAGIQTREERIAEALHLLRDWATEKHLAPSETEYLAKTPARTPLRFSTSGDAAREGLYRTHWLRQDLSDKQVKRIKAASSRPPELVVVQSLKSDWTCHRCSGSGDLLIMEEPGPSCLPCAGLGALVFLAAGNATLSRRAKAKSEVHAVVVRFSRARKRYERQGLLVHPAALHEAERELGLIPTDPPSPP